MLLSLEVPYTAVERVVASRLFCTAIMYMACGMIHTFGMASNIVPMGYVRTVCA